MRINARVSNGGEGLKIASFSDTARLQRRGNPVSRSWFSWLSILLLFLFTKFLFTPYL